MSRRCLRCGREMTASHDAYGWRCAQILGIDQSGYGEARGGSSRSAMNRLDYAPNISPSAMRLRHVQEDGGGYYGGGYDDRNGDSSPQGYDRHRYDILDDYNPPKGFRKGVKPGKGEYYEFAEYVHCMDCDEEYKNLLIDLYNSIGDTSYGAFTPGSGQRERALSDMETVEILARLLYGEDSSVDGQALIAYSIINRVIGDGRYKLGGEAYGIDKGEDGVKFLRNIITGPDYNAIATPHDSRRSYRVSEIIANDENEKLAWENAKLLAVLVYSLIGDHTSGELNNSRTNQGKLHSPESADKYLSRFTDVNGDRLTNQIDDRDSYGNYGSSDGLIDSRKIGKHTFYKSVHSVYK